VWQYHKMDYKESLWMYPHGPGYGYLIGGGSGLPIISVIQIKMVLETVEPGSSGSKPSALVTRLVQSIL